MMRARWFLCWHEHELDLSCFVVLRLDWTREPRLKYGFEMDWRLLYRSQTGHTFKQKRKMIKQKVSLHWLCDCDGIGNLLFLVVSSCSCFGIFAIALCLTEQEAKAPFFADQPVHTVRAFDQSYLISPKSPLLPTSRIVCFGISDPNKTRKETHVARKKTETSSTVTGLSNLKKMRRFTSWTLIFGVNHGSLKGYPPVMPFPPPLKSWLQYGLIMGA